MSAERAEIQRTFFVSYTGEDVRWATWIAECIEREPGWKAVVQAWDFVASSNFGLEMHRAASEADHTIAVFSPAYFESKFATAEWIAAWVADPEGQDARVIPVLVKECWPEGLLKPIVYVSLLDIDEEAVAQTTLIAELKAAIDGTRERKSSGYPGRSSSSSSPGRRPIPHRHIYGAPAPTATFVGRLQELDRLTTQLATGDVAVSTAIEGLAGVGKSELASMLIQRLAFDGQFNGGIYWVVAENPDLTSEWARIALSLGVDGTAKNAVRHMIVRIENAQGPVLIVLDNVEDWSGKDRPAPLPTARYLITTRRRRLGGNRFNHFTLGLLNPREARELMEKIAGEDVVAEDGFEALLKHLDGHTLAVELAGVFLAEMGGEETPASYLRLLRAGESHGAQLTDQIKHGETVGDALQVLFERASPQLRHAWMVCARFEADSVHRELLEAAGVSSEARQLLLRWHLVEVEAAVYRMHRLVNAFGREAGNEEERTSAAEAHIRGLMAVAGTIDLATGYRSYRAHQTHFDATIERPPWIAPDDWSAYLDSVATGRRSAALFSQANEAFMITMQQNSKFNYFDVEELQSNFAAVLKDVGNLQVAKTLFEQALASGLAHHGEDAPTVAMRRSYLAGVLRDMGDLQGAKALFEQALESDLASLGESDPTVVIRRQDLALVLLPLGDLSGAKALLETCLASDLANLGDEHPNVATTRANLAVVLYQNGDFEGAATLAASVLVWAETHLGDSHPWTGRMAANYALMLRELGREPEARSLAARALRIARLQSERSSERIYVEERCAWAEES